MEASKEPQPRKTDAAALDAVLGCDPTERPLFAPDSGVFDARYYNLQQARAEVENPRGPEDNSARNRLYADIELAEALLIATPAVTPWQVMRKFEIAEQIVAEEIKGGAPNTPRVLLALASARFDLIAALGDAPPPAAGNLV